MLHVRYYGLEAFCSTLGTMDHDNTPIGGETVSTLSVEALEASRGLRGPVNKPEQLQVPKTTSHWLPN